jgi:hypothetical protein
MVLAYTVVLTKVVATNVICHIFAIREIMTKWGV